MAEAMHSAAPHYLPPFITGPGETDSLFVFIVVLLIVIVLAIGNIYFRLHALPEKMAHSSNSAQLQLVGVLALLAMFTHNNLFWVAALLLAAFRVPDITTPLAAIADSVGKLSARLDQQLAVPTTPAANAVTEPGDASEPVELAAPAAPESADVETAPSRPETDQAAERPEK